MRALTSILGAVTMMLALAQCSPAVGPGTAPEGNGSSHRRSAPALPPTTGVFDYQLDGTDDTVSIDGRAHPVTVVVRDAASAPLEGAYNVCYVNGFQSQPEDAAMWRDHPELLLEDAAGEPVTDPDWPGEYILDPSTSTQREKIVQILGPLIAGCAAAGFDAVEIDNLDTFTRFPQIEQDAALALASVYVALAHEEGLAIAQKNTAEITRIGHDEIGFDFAIAEECAAWDECGAYAQVYGPHVLQIEYPDTLEAAGITFENACTRPDRAPLIIRRDRYLAEAGAAERVYEIC